ncbi:MAG TPA: helix-turn-helix domain-containing protein, partial [Nitrososphaeraceae archaeon]|nr:helix-turn-helix domain-containing protein [Nitrososphaeraceae archaeon]
MSSILLNKFEEEKRVIELHLEGKTIREIAKEVHISFRDISNMIKGYSKKIRLESKQKENNHSNQIKKLSPSSQAFELFNKGKKPIDVAIELDFIAEKAEKLWSQFLKLKRMDDCYEFYQECQYDLPVLLSINNFMKKNNVHIKDITNILRGKRHLKVTINSFNP